MRLLAIAAIVVGIVSAMPSAGAQETVRSLETVRLTFERIEQVALDFGVDSVALRDQAVRRLAAGDIQVVDDSRHPELVVAVRVPKRLVPDATGGLVFVELTLVEPGAANRRRMLWNAVNDGVWFTRYGSLREFVPEQLTLRVNELLAARAGT